MKGKISPFRAALAVARKETRENREESIRSENIALRNEVKRLQAEVQFLTNRLGVNDAEESPTDTGAVV